MTAVIELTSARASMDSARILQGELRALSSPGNATATSSSVSRPGSSEQATLRTSAKTPSYGPITAAAIPRHDIVSKLAVTDHSITSPGRAQ